MSQPASIRSSHVWARRGSVMVYGIVGMTALFGVVSFTVDWGRVQYAKSQLRVAADSAARYGVTGLTVDAATVRARCKAAAAENSVEGSPVVLTDSDIEFGNWNATTRAFAVRTPTASDVNALRITSRCAASRGTAIPLWFAAVLGRSSMDVTATSIVRYEAPTSLDTIVPSGGNPWLAGEPDGTLDNTNLYNASVRSDRAGAYTDPSGVYHPQGESPTLMNTTAVRPGEYLSFDSISGTGSNGSTQTVVGPDGDLTRITHAWAGSHLGKSDVYAPINSVIAVFLTDADPTNATPPSVLDFTSAASRDFTTLSPEIGQTFFIGDGLTSGGVVQQIRVPPGATRLYIGKMDGTEWNNNVGTSTVTTYRPQRITTVK